MAHLAFVKMLKSDIDVGSIISAKAQFKDKDFPPEKISLGPSYNYHFKTAKEIYEGKYQLFDSFNSDDIIQGKINDAYFLSAVAAVAEVPSRIERLFKFKDVNTSGYYPVSLCIAGYPTTVVLDDYFPVLNDSLVFARTKSQSIWVMLLEKAWAKINGNYSKIEEGDPKEALGALTGAPTENFDHFAFKNKRNDFWEKIKEFDKLSYVICAGGVKKKTQGLEDDRYYTILKTYECKNENEEIRLLKLRNNLGKGVWDGDWSLKDSIKWTPEIMEKLKPGKAEDGTFFISFDDFFKHFSFTTVAKVMDSYISTHINYEKTEAFAAFKISENLSGFISAYQFTKRIVKNIGKDQNYENLNLELYMVVGNSFKSLKLKATSSEFCDVNIQVNLEPGTYIIHAFFRQPSQSFPFINLIVYADKAVELVRLEIGKLDEVAPHQIEGTFASGKKVYSAHKALEYGFSTCNSGHLLKWNKDPYSSYYLCEGCRESIISEDGHWSCDQCNIDVCSKCKLRRPTGSSFDLPKCLLGHGLFFKSITDNSNAYLCKKCGSAFESSLPHWNCKICKSDICTTCLAAPKGYKKVEKARDIMAFPNYNKIKCSTTKINDKGKNICVNCGQKSQASKENQYCEFCRSSSNRPSRKTAETVEALNYSLPTSCSKYHSFEFSSMKVTGEKEMNCHKCNNIIKSGDWRWNCSKCQYQICDICREAPKGRKDITCLKKHMLIFSNSPVRKFITSKCAKCLNSFNVTKGRYCCTICDYDLCLQCEPFVMPNIENAATGGEMNATEKKNNCDPPQLKRSDCCECTII